MGSTDQPFSTSTNSKATWSLQSALKDVSKPVTSPSSSPLAFLHIIEKLKTTPREGWRRFDIQHGESIADHMYRMSIITMLCPDPSIKRDHCVKMAIIHDMAESLVGDITPVDGVTKEDKHSRELQTMEYLKGLLEPFNPAVGAEIMSIWQEYEDGITPEAIFVKDVDKYELLVQMIEYEKKYNAKKDLSEFHWVATRITTEYVKQWADDVMEERKQFWASAKKNN
ncbi:putative hydrolases of HD superfamily [Peziza echinospora]|nr:putative hydrolases of HD superfamily [Peziza echinospora]